MHGQPIRLRNLSSSTSAELSNPTKFKHIYSFDENVFFDDDFDVHRFISRCRKTCGLEKLSEDLALFGNHLKGRLVDVLNQEYSSFLDLAHELNDIPDRLDTIQKPLDNLQSSMEIILKSIDAKKNDLDGLVQSKKFLSDKKRVLELIIYCDKSLKRFTTLMQRFEDEPNLSLEELSVLLLRCCHEYKTITDLSSDSYHSNMSKYQIVQKHCTSIQEYRTQLLEKCKTIFLSISSSTASNVSILMKRQLYSYEMLGISSMYECVGADIISPIFTKYASAWNGDADVNVVTDTIGNVLDSVLGEIQSISQILVNDNIKECVLEKCIGEMTGFGSKLFVTGIPDRFVKHFTTSMNFIYNLAAFMGISVHHQYIQSFKHEWKLSIYFRQRRLHITSTFEENLSKHPIHAFIQSIRLCWDENIHLVDLSKEFYELSIHLTHRLQQYINSSTTDSLFDICTIYSDLSKYPQSLLTNIFRDHLSSKQQLSPELISSMSNSFMMHLSFLDHALENTGAVLREQTASNAIRILEENVPKLKTLLRVSSSSSGNRRGPEAFPSEYVTELVRDITRSLDMFKELGIESETIKEILEYSVVHIYKEYESLIGEALVEMEKMDATVRRLKSSAAASSRNSGGKVSLLNLLKIQLNLDFDELSNQIQSMNLSLPASSIDPIQELLK